jgi:hypothetical protein
MFVVIEGAVHCRARLADPRRSTQGTVSGVRAEQRSVSDFEQRAARDVRVNR